jgi:hypothetical protein
MKVGDKVIVDRRIIPGDDWDDEWVGEMDDYVGESGIVVHVRTRSIRIQFTNHIRYNFPLEAVKLANPPFKEKTIEDI